MEMTLLIEGEKKNFKLPAFIPAVIFRKSIQFAQMMDDSSDNLDPAVLEQLVTFIANDIYAGQFTPDQFWEGVDSRDFMSALQLGITAPTFRGSAQNGALAKA